MEKSIPDFLAHLPVYRGMPVPYFVPKDKDGQYLFKFASGEKMDSCIAYHKCCICFRPLVSGQYFFVSGPRGRETQTDSHPPMHKQCAEYSLRICPHLFYEKTHRTTGDVAGEAWQIKEKPKEFFLVWAKKFDSLKLNNVLVVRYSSVVRHEHFIYKDGILNLNQKHNEQNI